MNDRISCTKPERFVPKAHFSFFNAPLFISVRSNSGSSLSSFSGSHLFLFHLETPVIHYHSSFITYLGANTWRWIPRYAEHPLTLPRTHVYQPRPQGDTKTEEVNLFPEFILPQQRFCLDYFQGNCCISKDKGQGQLFISKNQIDS